MTEAAKQALTLKALGLLNEQVQARIVHYKGEMETNAELDAITAQVVAQLKEMQAVIGHQSPVAQSNDQVESKHTETLTRLLERAFSPGEQSLVARNIKPVGKRIAKLFFESELHEKTKGEKEKKIYHAEQGVYYVLGRYKHRLRTELEGFDFINDDIKQLSLDLLTKMERDLQVAFLSRRSPELNRVMTIFTGVLLDFFHKHLPERLPQMAKITVRAAKTAAGANSVAYKIQTDRFADFRKEWERILMEQMIHYVGDELLARLSAEGDEDVREETVKFFTDPHIFSETCEVICANLYDFLCLEGFLDLPVDWRVKLGDGDN
ncbi:MAG TPA: hypothetical protein VL137_00270 [Polyangiaceae bacterium]|jgi:hypothetical protein|nr:hypothetical protein [Polyangiaceae bacterium]